MQRLIYLLAFSCLCVLQPLEDSVYGAEREVLKFKTDEGIEWGSWGILPAKPAPTLIVLASTIDETLGSAYFRQSGNRLAESGFLIVSIDLPCHGLQHRPGEPEGLKGWPNRCKQGENFVAKFNIRLAAVLDHLIKVGYCDASHIAICGTSRGGYLALQFTAHDPRVQAVAAFAPVTDLTALREFEGMESVPLVQTLSVIKQADQFKERPVWLVIGDRDERVGTDHTIELARKITSSSLTKGLKSSVELHVIAEPKGHTVPPGSAEQAADWFLRHMKK